MGGEKERMCVFSARVMQRFDLSECVLTQTGVFMCFTSLLLASNSPSTQVNLFYFMFGQISYKRRDKWQCKHWSSQRRKFKWSLVREADLFSCPNNTHFKLASFSLIATSWTSYKAEEEVYKRDKQRLIYS